MPIQETKAKLWHPTKAERDAYDDLMIANIELKSLDFDDENFSPVFNRTKQEFFLEPSEKYKQDIARIARPFKAFTCEEFIDKYVLIKPNHTYYREWTLAKYMSGFGFSYLLLRELPLRNFYARCFIMYLFFAKVADNMSNFLPYCGNYEIIVADDQWRNKDIRNYRNASTCLNYIELPNSSNRIDESKLWRARQPGHLKWDNKNWVGHYFNNFKGKAYNQEVPWDGTMNMPLDRLADPQHKDAHMIHWH